jgi:hypothetical protein
MEAALQDLVFLFNVYDPSREDAFEKLVSTEYGVRSSRKSNQEKVDEEGTVVASVVSSAPPTQEAYDWMLNFINGKIKGAPVPPKGSELTSEELVEMGYIGLWEPVFPAHRRCAPMSGAGGLFQTYSKAVRLGSDKKWYPIEAVLSEPRVKDEKTTKNRL